MTVFGNALFITRKCGVIMFSLASVSVSVYNALTSESLDLKLSFLVRMYTGIFRISQSSAYIKIIISRSRSRSQEQKACLCTLFAGGLPSIVWIMFTVIVNSDVSQGYKCL